MPIEFMNGFIKQDLQRNYEEIPGTELQTLCNSFVKFSSYDMRAVFLKCGYGEDGVFDLLRNLHWRF
jgi:hypothetical protein